MTDILKEVHEPYDISFAELYAGSNIPVIAGSETSAAVLAFTTYYLLKAPDAIQKLVKEIRSSFKREDHMRFRYALSLEYLGAVINGTHLHLNRTAPWSRTFYMPGDEEIADQRQNRGTYHPPTAARGHYSSDAN